MPANIAKGVYKVEADTKQAQAANKGLKSSLGGLVSPGALAAGAIAGVGFAAFKSVKGTVAAAGALHKMNLRTGVSTESLSQMEFALEQSGTNLAVFEKGLKTMSGFVFDAGRGLATQTEALQALGLELDDLAGKSPEEQFQTFADALAGVADASTRAALAQDVFGGAGTKLLPILLEGKDGIEALKNEADALGKTIDQDTANSAAKLEDNLNVLTTGFGGLKQNLAEAVIPALANLTTEFNENVLPVIRDDVLPVIKAIAEDALPVLKVAFQALATVAGDIFGQIGSVFAAFRALFEGDLEGFATNIVKAWTAPLRTMVSLLESFGVNFGDIWIGIQRVAQDALNGLIGLVEGALNKIAGAANSVLGFFKLPTIGPISVGRVDFADGLQTSAERQAVADARAADVSAAASADFARIVAGQRRAAIASGYGGGGAGALFRGGGGATSAPTIILNGNVIAPGGQEAAQWVANSLARAERSGYVGL